MRNDVDVTSTITKADQPSRIAVLGLGYVGAVSAACLASQGHTVVGVDVNPIKIEQINSGRTPVGEDHILELIGEAVGDGRLRATVDVADAITSTDIAIVCVGTPSEPNGGLDTQYLERVSENIGSALPARGSRYVVVFRSTMLPGTCEDKLIPILESSSGLTAGVDFGVCVNPEFLREGTAVADYFDPPKTVIGESDEESGAVVEALYGSLPGPVHRVPVRVAEMSKYVDNGFHALKVGFANEIGAICDAVGLDSHQVMEIFKADTKLNISSAYLTPGFAFGGSCLPKDLRAILHRSRDLHLDVPIMSAILPSNDRQVLRVYDHILETGAQRVGIFGLSFKAGTDDLRESPLVELAERLLGRGKELVIYDNHVAVSALHGANREYVESRIPHLARLMVDTPAEVVETDLVVVAAAGDDVVDVLMKTPDDFEIVALTRRDSLASLESRPGYTGISW